MEKGEAPSEGIEREWEKMVQNEDRKAKELATLTMVCTISNVLQFHVLYISNITQVVLP